MKKLGFSLAVLLLLSACSPQAAAPVASATAVAPTETRSAPTPTNTTEPTATPTEAPTATQGEVMELPFNGFERILPVIQGVEPEAYVETAPCVNYGEEKCVVAVNFCPEGKECPHLLWISDAHQVTLSLGGDEEKASEFLDGYMDEFPNSFFDGKLLFKLAQNTSLDGVGTGILLNPEMQVRLNCMFGTPPERIPWRVAAYPITDAAFKELVAWGLEVTGPFEKSEACQ